jgi:large subunit ribosomal protein MRP49
MRLLIALDDPGDLPEIEEHQHIEFTYQAATHADLGVRIDGALLEPFLRPGEQRWRWIWNPGAAVGTHRLVFAANGQEHLLVLTVVPRALDRERYLALIEDVRASAGELALRLGGGREASNLTHTQVSTGLLSSYYALFEERLGSFVRAAYQIARQPRDRLHANQKDVALEQAVALDPARTPSDFIPAPPGLAWDLQESLRPGGGFLPSRGLRQYSQASADTYEHRLLRHTIDLLIRRAQQIGAYANVESARGLRGSMLAEAQQIAARCEAALAQLRELRALPLFQDVGELQSVHGPTPLLQREPAYREVYRMWQALRRAPQLGLDSALFSLPIAELPRLYELWCVLRVALALVRSDWAIEDATLLEEPAQGQLLELRIVPGVLLQLRNAAWRVRLRYQPRYRPEQRSETIFSRDRHTRVPDLALEADSPDGSVHVLVFDAKYRLDLDRQHVPVDALAEAYAYRGALATRQGACVDLAIILFPTASPPERYASGVGAFGLLPGMAEYLDDVIGSWLSALH